MVQQSLTKFSSFSCKCSFNEPIINVQLAGNIHIHSKQSERKHKYSEHMNTHPLKSGCTFSF